MGLRSLGSLGAQDATELHLGLGGARSPGLAPVLNHTPPTSDAPSSAPQKRGKSLRRRPRETHGSNLPGPGIVSSEGSGHKQDSRARCGYRAGVVPLPPGPALPRDAQERVALSPTSGLLLEQPRAPWGSGQHTKVSLLVVLLLPPVLLQPRVVARPGRMESRDSLVIAWGAWRSRGVAG